MIICLIVFIVILLCWCIRLEFFKAEDPTPLSPIYSNDLGSIRYENNKPSIRDMMTTYPYPCPNLSVDDVCRFVIKHHNLNKITKAATTEITHEPMHKLST